MYVRDSQVHTEVANAHAGHNIHLFWPKTTVLIYFQKNQSHKLDKQVAHMVHKEFIAGCYSPGKPKLTPLTHKHPH